MLIAVGMEGLGSARFAIVSGIGPVWTAVLAWGMVGERPTAVAWFGMAVTIVGGVLAGTAKRSAQVAAVPADVRGPGVGAAPLATSPNGRR